MPDTVLKFYRKVLGWRCCRCSIVLKVWIERCMTTRLGKNYSTCFLMLWRKLLFHFVRFWLTDRTFFAFGTILLVVRFWCKVFGVETWCRHVAGWTLWLWYCFRKSGVSLNFTLSFHRLTAMVSFSWAFVQRPWRDLFLLYWSLSIRNVICRI